MAYFGRPGGRNQYVPALSYGEDAWVDTARENAAQADASERTRGEKIELALQSRKDQVFRAVVRLTSQTITREELDACPLTSQEFVDLCEERSVSANGLCGLPTCSKVRGSEGLDEMCCTKAKYEVSSKDKRVYNMEAMSAFCSRECAIEAEDYARNLGTTVSVDETTWTCFVPPRTTRGAKVGAQVVGTSAAPDQGLRYRVETNAGQSGAVESAVKEREASSSRGQQQQQQQQNQRQVLPSALKKESPRNEVRDASSSKKRVTFRPDEATAPMDADPNQPVIYFEIDEMSDASGEKKQVGRLKIVDDGQASEEALSPAEAEAEAVASPQDGMVQQGSDKRALPYNLTSLYPAQGREQSKQALVKALGESRASVRCKPCGVPPPTKEDPAYPSSSDLLQDIDHVLVDAEDGWEQDDDSEDIEDCDADASKFQVTMLSSFGSIWEWLDSQASEKTLSYLDPSWQHSQAPRRPEAWAGREQRERAFSEQLSRILERVYSDLELSSGFPSLSQVDLCIGRLVGTLLLDKAVPSFTYDEWNLLGFVLVRAVGEHLVVEVKTHLEGRADKVSAFVVRCGLTTTEVNMILRILLPALSG